MSESVYKLFKSKFSVLYSSMVFLEPCWFSKPAVLEACLFHVGSKGWGAWHGAQTPTPQEIFHAFEIPLNYVPLHLGWSIFWWKIVSLPLLPILILSFLSCVVKTLFFQFSGPLQIIVVYSLYAWKWVSSGSSGVAILNLSCFCNSYIWEFRFIISLISYSQSLVLNSL